MAALPPTDPTAFIASALAPAVALSACAILTSNAQNKYSGLIDRLRSLNAERRDYQAKDPVLPSDALRIKSLDRQIALIFRRSHYVRDAIVLLCAAMALMILTSFLIAAARYFPQLALSALPRWSFLGGLLLVFGALFEELLEVRLAFRVVRYELGLFDERTAREVERQFKNV